MHAVSSLLTVSLAALACSAATVDDIPLTWPHRHRHKKPPKLPANFETRYTYSIPYTSTYLPEPLSYPVELWVNSKHNMMRMDTYDGLNSEIDRNGMRYVLSPEIDQLVCSVGVGADDSSADSAKVDSSALTHPLLGDGIPALEGWKFDSMVDYEGAKAEKWVFEVTKELKTSKYTYIISKQGYPLYLHMMGAEIDLGAHFDEYELKFEFFQPLDEDNLSAFEVPETCKDTSHRSERISLPMGNAFTRLLPHIPGVNTDYEVFATQQGRKHADSEEARMRATLYHHHDQLIKQHNVRTESKYKLAHNKFSDWTEQEYKGLLGRRVLLDTEARAKRPTFQANNFMPLPGYVDWRSSGAVGPVKDQGVCGSCWSFSASQVMSSAWWMKTGKYVSLSEQQLMDCSWEYGYGDAVNSACDGGWPELAVQYAIDSGGAFREFDYPYKGVDDYCKQNSTTVPTPSMVKVKSVKFVKEYDSEGVRRALYTHGPLSIGLDAEPVPLRFYSSGVLNTEKCSSAPEAIDHAVLLVGYGEEDGVPYWLVKNEWSAYWGDEGYIKIDRNNDCGIATEAFYVETE